jgi:hypothetical protein
MIQAPPVTNATTGLDLLQSLGMYRSNLDSICSVTPVQYMPNRYIYMTPEAVIYLPISWFISINYTSTHLSWKEIIVANWKKNMNTMNRICSTELAFIINYQLCKGNFFILYLSKVEENSCRNTWKSGENILFHLWVQDDTRKPESLIACIVPLMKPGMSNIAYIRRAISCDIHR